MRIKKRYLLLASIFLTVYLNLQFQWHRGRVYINPMPPVTFNKFADRDTFAVLGIQSQLAIGHRTYRMDTTDGGAVTSETHFISVCGRFFCRVLARNIQLLIPLDETGYFIRKDFLIDENGVAVLAVGHDSFSVESRNYGVTYPRNIEGDPPHGTLRDLVFFNGNNPPVVVRGAPLTGPDRRSLRDIIQSECDRRRVSRCPIPDTVP
jgi:hypothetical protein